MEDTLDRFDDFCCNEERVIMSVGPHHHREFAEKDDTSEAYILAGHAFSIMLMFEDAAEMFIRSGSVPHIKQCLDNSIYFGCYPAIEMIESEGITADPVVMSDYLTKRAIPNIPLYREFDIMSGKDEYFIDGSTLRAILDRNGWKEDKLDEVVEDMLLKGNENYIKQKLLLSFSKDRRLIDEVERRYKQKHDAPRDGVRHVAMDHCDSRGLMFLMSQREGDTDTTFPEMSHVFLVTDGKKQYTLKENLHLYHDFSKADGYCREDRILARLDHPAIPKLIDCSTRGGIEFIMWEYAGGTHLSDLVRSRYPLDDVQIKDVIHQTADILCYLKGQGVLHKDIKAENMMLENGNVSLFDFGIAQETDKTGKCRSSLSTAECMPPELGEYFCSTYQSEIFQLGVLAYGLISGEHPFATRVCSEERTDLLMNYCLANMFRQPRPFNREVDKDLSDLVFSMLENNPNKRPTCEWVLKVTK
ncbi:hypothetical protein COV93_04755 [Candidatus Woesearchaeota archaeon CG11_big_fil_rev_8_21_14_0_20_43_8]|nr:MAG: hypothetical protein COV93_04755 [Candidatus Woesearchaeota archaeon CG11_big_fil_rev_8_21_14_0_20_43_8]